MKKSLLVAGIFMAVTAQQTFAQEQGFHAGLVTGYNYTIILDKGVFDSPSYDHQATFRASPVGLALGYQWDTGFGIQAEMIRANIGQELDILHKPVAGGDFVAVGKKEINLRYWQIPILFKLQKGSEKVRFSFQLGPQISLLSKAEDVETYDEAVVHYEGNHSQPVIPGHEYLIGSNDEDARYAFNELAVGLVAGTGVDVFFTKNVYMSAYIRAGYNFTEIREEEGGTKFVDTYLNTVTTEAPTDTEDTLYKKELRSAAFGGLQIGIHYMFGNNE